MNEQEFIYVVFVKAMTGLGKLIRKINPYEYTHIAVSMDEDLTDFVAFSRKLHHSPFLAGFMHERREHYAFGENEFAEIKVYKVPVSKENKENILAFISQIENDSEYIFNLFSMISMPIFHGIRIYKAHDCMSFVGKVLELSGAVKLQKMFYKMNIPEMEFLLQGFECKKVELKKIKEDENYMQKVSLWRNAKACIRLNCTLLYRLIMKRKEKYV